MSYEIIAIVIFILLLVVQVLLRAKTGDKYQIKNADIVIALIPIVLVLFLSGKVQELAFGDFKVVLAVKKTTESPISAEVTKLPIEEVQVGQRQSLVERKQYIEKRTPVISFQFSKFSRGGSDIIVDYLELAHYPFLRYILFYNTEGVFFGMADAQQVAAMAEVTPFKDIAFWILNAQEIEIKNLAGFVSAQESLHEDDDKITALKKMNTLNVAVLPVVDKSNRFTGIIEQNKLAANMLTDILEGLKRAE
jgi:hypothetical protein